MLLGSVSQRLQGLREVREKGSKRRAKPLLKHYSQHTVKITGVNVADAVFFTTFNFVFIGG
jgi:hypothetical protein